MYDVIYRNLVYTTVMPMRIFVSCVGDLANGGSVVVVTPVRSPPAFFFCETLGIRKFLPWQFP